MGELSKVQHTLVSRAEESEAGTNVMTSEIVMRPDQMTCMYLKCLAERKVFTNECNTTLYLCIHKKKEEFHVIGIATTKLTTSQCVKEFLVLLELPSRQ